MGVGGVTAIVKSCHTFSLSPAGLPVPQVMSKVRVVGVQRSVAIAQCQGLPVRSNLRGRNSKIRLRPSSPPLVRLNHTHTHTKPSDDNTDRTATGH